MQNISAEDKPSFSSKELHKKVVEANIFRQKRGQKNFNAKMADSELEAHCVMSAEANETLEMAIERFRLSFRSIKKVQKVSRTIADLASSEVIEKEHLLEALSYRRR